MFWLTKVVLETVACSDHLAGSETEASREERRARSSTLEVIRRHPDNHGRSEVAPLMELKPNAGSDRAWVWNTHADFADEHPKPELLAIRFLNAENAQKFKAKVDECREEVKRTQEAANKAAQVAEELKELSVKDEKSTESSGE
ncbi:RANG protein, partial [Polypterus senegalus]